MLLFLPCLLNFFPQDQKVFYLYFLHSGKLWRTTLLLGRVGFQANQVLFLIFSCFSQRCLSLSLSCFFKKHLDRVHFVWQGNQRETHGVYMGCSNQFAAEAVLMKQDIFAFDICEDHEKFPAWATLWQAWSFLQPKQISKKNIVTSNEIQLNNGLKEGHWHEQPNQKMCFVSRPAWLINQARSLKLETYRFG